MREAELKREVMASANWQVFYVAVLGMMLVIAVMYFLTQYVVGYAGASDAAIPVDVSSPAEDTPGSSGNTTLINPGSVAEPEVYFS